MDRPRRHGHEFVFHAELVDVRSRREVHGRAHRTVPLQSPQIIFQTY